MQPNNIKTQVTGLRADIQNIINGLLISKNEYPSLPNLTEKELKVEELLREIVMLKGQLQFTKEKLEYINNVLANADNK